MQLVYSKVLQASNGPLSDLPGEPPLSLQSSAVDQVLDTPLLYFHIILSAAVCFSAYQILLLLSNFA